AWFSGAWSNIPCSGFFAWHTVSPVCLAQCRHVNLFLSDRYRIFGMAQLFVVHPQNPQARLLKQAGALLEKGGLVAVPTDSSYAVLARLDDKAAADALRRLRGLDDRHHLTLLCRDLAEIGHFAKVDNQQYRLLKMATPGPWTF